MSSTTYDPFNEKPLTDEQRIEEFAEVVFDEVLTRMAKSSVGFDCGWDELWDRFADTVADHNPSDLYKRYLALK